MRLEISKEWTPEERIALVTALRREQMEGNTTGGKAFDVAERIRLIVSMPAAFLEVNREAILGGNVIPARGCTGEPPA